MKFLHLADLHLGKRIGQYDLFDVQKDMLEKIVELTKERKLDAVVVAGDIYDSQTPSASATILLSSFLADLNKIGVSVLMISGNHDQADRLEYASEVLRNNNIYIVTKVSDSLKPIRIKDVNFYLLPFINKYDVKWAFNLDETLSLNDSIKYVIEKMNINKKEKNVIVSHQAVLGSKDKTTISGSEVSIEKHDKEGVIAGEDVVPSKLYSDFDYVALGHIHKILNIENNMRYPGALLKYHKDEANNKKNFTIVDTTNFNIEEVTIKPLRDVVYLKGSFDNVIKHKEYKDDYTFFELDDDIYINDCMSKLKEVFPFAVSITYKEKKSKELEEKIDYQDVEEISKLDLFSEFFKLQMGKDLSDAQIEILNDMIKETFKQ